MTEGLVDLLPDFLGEATRTQCFGHILNLVVKAILRLFNVDPSKDNTEDSADKCLSTIMDDMDKLELNSDNLPNNDALDLEDQIDKELAELEVFLDINKIQESIQLMRSMILKVRSA
jgi:hypothetical protein